jgi:hypothetical protein
MPAPAFGTNFFLRRGTPEDPGAYLRVMGHPDVQAQLLQLPYASEAFWRKRLAVGNADDLPLVAVIDGVIVGTAGLHRALPLRRAHTGTLAIGVLPEAQAEVSATPRWPRCAATPTVGRRSHGWS